MTSLSFFLSLSLSLSFYHTFILPTHPIPKKSTCWLPSSSLALTSSASLSPRALLMARWYLARLGNAHYFFFNQPPFFLTYLSPFLAASYLSS